MKPYFFALLGMGFLYSAALAHDTWITIATPITRVGDVVHIDLMLGNHGNDHRDFKLASKLPAENIASFEVLAPDGTKTDLKKEMVDLGNQPKEGFHSSRFIPSQAGLHVAAQTLDRVMKHGKSVRGYRSAKAFFVAGDSLDKPAARVGFDKPLGHKIELISETDPIDAAPGREIRVKLLFEGKPLSGVKVAFIPRGATLKEGTDPDHEKTTDKEGIARYTPKVGTYHLIVAHYPRDVKGSDYDSEHYAASIALTVPQKPLAE